MESLIHAALTNFGRAKLDTPWLGKEREAVSYYAFGFLAKASGSDTSVAKPILKKNWSKAKAAFSL